MESWKDLYKICTLNELGILASNEDALYEHLLIKKGADGLYTMLKKYETKIDWDKIAKLPKLPPDFLKEVS